MPAYAVKTPPQHGEWKDILAVWREADDIDVFESAWTMDHFYPLVPPTDGPHLESWAVLAAMAQATTRIRLGCMVNGMHYRHPAVTANAAATVDHISGGRFVLGLGAGWYQLESDAYGIQLGSLTERFDRFDEGLEVISSLLTLPTMTFAGRYYRLTDAHCEPKPVQARLPIAIGGTGPTRTLPSVARWADHWDSFTASPEAWTRTNDVLLGHCQRIGRDPSTIRRSVHLMWNADAAPSEMADLAAAHGDVGVDLVIFSMRGPFDARLLAPLAAALRG